MQQTTTRRHFLGSIAAATATSPLLAQNPRPKKILLRSGWQTVNIGDIAHTPGMLKLLQDHVRGAEVTLWPNSVDRGVEDLLKKRFPQLQIAKTEAEQTRAIEECDFCLHGSGSGLPGQRVMNRWRQTKKPYGFGGVSPSDVDFRDQRDLLSQASFVFCRDTASLRVLQETKIQGPEMAFGPDATFVLDLRDDASADTFLREHDLTRGKFICVVPRLRWTPYWETDKTRKYDPDELKSRQATNEQFREVDHAKLREAIIAWVRETGHKAVLCPEMTYAIPLLRPLLYDRLPDEIKRKVVIRPGYWMPSEAASFYGRAFAVVSCEMHSPIIAHANGTPAIHVRQPTDTRKGQMWRDVGLADWIFEIDECTGKQIADRLLDMYRNQEQTRRIMARSQQIVRDRTRAMMDAVNKALGS